VLKEVHKREEAAFSSVRRAHWWQEDGRSSCVGKRICRIAVCWDVRKRKGEAAREKRALQKNVRKNNQDTSNTAPEWFQMLKREGYGVELLAGKTEKKVRLPAQ